MLDKLLPWRGTRVKPTLPTGPSPYPEKAADRAVLDLAQRQYGPSRDGMINWPDVSPLLWLMHDRLAYLERQNAELESRLAVAEAALSLQQEK